MPVCYDKQGRKWLQQTHLGHEHIRVHKMPKQTLLSVELGGTLGTFRTGHSQKASLVCDLMIIEHTCFFKMI